MHAAFPRTRPRRLRQSPWIRELVAQARLHVSDLIWPCFVQEGQAAETPIPSLPGVARLSIDRLVAQARLAASLGIPAIAIFPVTDGAKKDARGSEALRADNLVCSAIAAVKSAVPDLGIIADVALDPYTSHGHDGIVENGAVVNDATVELLAQQALILAQAGADMVAPSDMMDGRIGAIRDALEGAGHTDTLILAYSAKYASSLYGPFRDAVDSATCLGKADKRGYQMHAANSDEALREMALDIAEGADAVMVKPGGYYLDIVQRMATQASVPVMAYQVSGEYAMIQAAAQQGWLDGQAVLAESLLAFKRAGARAVLTYGALEMAKGLV